MGIMCNSNVFIEMTVVRNEKVFNGMDFNVIVTLLLTVKRIVIRHFQSVLKNVLNAISSECFIKK